MKTKTIIIIIIILLLLATIFFLIPSLVITPLTGKAIETQYPYTHTYTKAICNKSNYCEDNVITCQGNKTISIQPITGAAVQHPENWQDPRNEETIEELC